jgi:transposase/DNA-directed RNA polymerase subunit RPC12/RpoP
MDKEFLEVCLTEGMSLETIGEQAGKHPSTVSYWLRKHGLEPVAGSVHTPKGPIDRHRLVELIEEGVSLQEMAERLGRSVTAVRYWIARYELKRERCRRRTLPGGAKRVSMLCQRHGLTKFVLEGRGSYRCMRCRAEASARRRRRVKQILVEEAGGRCVICGYGRCQRALQFHHLDPATKRFHLGHRGHSRSIARSRAEVRKCVLLCANCHAEVEADLIKMPLNSTQ